jgi:hypothetical protein
MAVVSVAVLCARSSRLGHFERKPSPAPGWWNGGDILDVVLPRWGVILELQPDCIWSWVKTRSGSLDERWQPFWRHTLLEGIAFETTLARDLPGPWWPHPWSTTPSYGKQEGGCGAHAEVAASSRVTKGCHMVGRLAACNRP